MKDKDYYLTVKVSEIDTVNSIMQDLSVYNCDIHLDKRDSTKSYIFNHNFINYSKIGENIGKTSSEYKRDINFFNKVGLILDSFGISSNHKGYIYIIEAIRIMNTYGIDNYTMKYDIYSVISKWYGVDDSVIEHDIRNAIKNAWDKYNSNPDINTEMKIFKIRPTNIRFLKYISKSTFMSYISAN